MKVRIGFIGTGGISGMHLSSLAGIDSAEVVALSDINGENLEKKAQMVSGATCYSDFNQMLDKEELNAVYICTPPTVRYDPIKACVERGIPVFCEKPAAATIEDADRTLQLVKESGVHVEIGYVMRHSLLVKRMMELLRDDSITFVTSIYTCPMTINYLKGNPANAWFYKQEISGGGLVDQATHTFDLIRYYTGEITSVAVAGSNKFCPKTADYTVDDSNAVVMTSEDGVLVNHSHTWVHPSWRHLHLVCGEKRFYTLDLSTSSLTVADGDTTSVYKPGDRPQIAESKLFLDMVTSGDFSRSKSDFADAVKTFKLTRRCFDAMESRRFENL